jgi:hypothetical protein
MVLKTQKDPILKKLEKSDIWPQKCQFSAGSLMKMVGSLRGFEITRAGSSLILTFFFFQRTRTSSSLSLK